ncbi:hypothetical protein QBC40DRAFT_313769 [Triangularia verruculosa]|uniref:Transmembrane protein n=1 Tax=Triangularia verruculosa TaxID=2587418 RepID=A0AAN6X900_9PEZI|nr:hypothetical protein QBC40DRAFT_313769 [Triangularia verruculosa]
MRFRKQLALVIATALSWFFLVEGSPVSAQDENATVALPDTSPVGYGLLRYASPDLRRRLLGEEGGVTGGLGKRQCTTNQLTCVGWTNVCCPRGTTCCSVTTCCLAGYGCYGGYCLLDTVYTLTTTRTVWTTRYSTYTDYETSYSTYISVSYDYTTVTVRSRNGVATETEWTTVTREAAKRRQFAAPTATSTYFAVHTPLPTKPPRLEEHGTDTMELSPNHPGLVRRILERAGVVEKRASTAWITVYPTWTTTFWYYRTSWYYRYVTSVRYSTITSTKIIFDGASSTTTVQSTTTVYTQKPPPPAQTPPPNNPNPDPPPSNNTPAPPPADEPPQTKPPETVTLTQPPPDNTGGGRGGGDTNNTPPPPPDTIPVSVTVFLTPSNIILPTDSSASLNLKTSTSAGTVFIIATTETPTPDPAATTLPQGTVIGIGVGSALGGIALIAALVFFFLRYRRKTAASSVDNSTVGRNSQMTAVPVGGGNGSSGGHDSALYGVFGRKEIDSRSPSVTVSSPVVGSPSPGNVTGAGTVSSMSPPPQERQRGGSYISELEQNAGRRTPGMQELHETTRGSELYDTNGVYPGGGYGFQGGPGWHGQELPTRPFSPGLQEMPEEGHYEQGYMGTGQGQGRPVPYRQYGQPTAPDLGVRPPQMREARGESEGDPYGLGDVPYPSPEQLARGYGPVGGQGQGQGWVGR